MARMIESCLDIPKIQSCEVTKCSYNRDRSCHAVAITVGDSAAAHCDTFFSRARKGGIDTINAGVGACKMDSCKFNMDLECSSEQGIMVASKSGQAMCSTYAKR